MPWGREASCAIDVCAVQLPGRESRLNESPYTSIRELMDATFEAVQPYLDAPFALFGHSMGGLLAFEFARRIRRAGAPAPVRLFVSGHRAPELPRRHASMADLSDGEFVAEIRRRYAGVPDEILRQPDLLALFLPCLRADLALIEHYRYGEEPPLDCPISAYGGRDDPETTEPELAAWRAHTRARFTLRRFDGDHFYLRGARAELLAAVCRDLADVGEHVLSVAR